MEETKGSFRIETTSFFLHVIAMVFMLCDHLWGTVVPGNDWLTCIGRLAFPIYAFMIVEGYFRTKDLKKYVLRLLVFALISEIPFNLALGSRLLYPIHQNVLWSFLIAIALIYINERSRAKHRLWLRIIIGALTVLLGYIAGLITMVDFYHAGVLTTLVFYFFRHKKWWCYAGQLVFLWYVNTELLGGFGYEMSLFGFDFFIQRQAFALLALIPIWLYQGKQGYHSKAFQYFNYAFYPLHLLILGVIKLL